MTRYRLTARAQMHGEVREPGYVFTLAEGEAGPHRTVPKASVDSQIVDRLNAIGDLVDLPLYEEIPDEASDDALKVDGESGYPQPAREVDAKREDDAALAELGTLQAPDDEVYGTKPGSADEHPDGLTGGEPLLLDAPEHNGPDAPRYMDPILVDPLPPAPAPESAPAPKAD